jgi:Family of unknown function (DUF6152)
MKPLRSTAIALIVVIAALAAHTPSAFAHHGWSGYGEKAEQLTGTIKTIRFGNPHVSIDLESGKDVWEVILAPPSRMQRRELPEGTLKVGDKVTVEGYRHLEKQRELRAEWITVGDKQRVPLR